MLFKINDYWDFFYEHEDKSNTFINLYKSSWKYAKPLAVNSL